MILTQLWPWNKVKVIKPGTDPKRGYGQTRFEGPPLNSIHVKALFKVFVQSENMSIIFLEYMQQ